MPDIIELPPVSLFFEDITELISFVKRKVQAAKGVQEVKTYNQCNHRNVDNLSHLAFTGHAIKIATFLRLDFCPKGSQLILYFTRRRTIVEGPVGYTEKELKQIASEVEKHLEKKRKRYRPKIYFLLTNIILGVFAGAPAGFYLLGKLLYNFTDSVHAAVVVGMYGGVFFMFLLTILLILLPLALLANAIPFHIVGRCHARGGFVIKNGVEPKYRRLPDPIENFFSAEPYPHIVDEALKQTIQQLLKLKPVGYEEKIYQVVLTKRATLFTKLINDYVDITGGLSNMTSDDSALLRSFVAWKLGPGLYGNRIGLLFCANTDGERELLRGIEDNLVNSFNALRIEYLAKIPDVRPGRDFWFFLIEPKKVYLALYQIAIVLAAVGGAIWFLNLLVGLVSGVFK